jgi:hypothetical protein
MSKIVEIEFRGGEACSDELVLSTSDFVWEKVVELKLASGMDSESQLSDEGVFRFAKVCKFLTYFSLFQTFDVFISEDAMKSLVKSNPQLKYIEIYSCNLSDSFLEFLSQNLPNISTVILQKNQANNISLSGIAQLILSCKSQLRSTNLTHFDSFEFKKSENGFLKSVTFCHFNNDTTQEFTKHLMEFVSTITNCLV